jgi:hypothetical protein
VRPAELCSSLKLWQQKKLLAPKTTTATAVVRTRRTAPATTAAKTLTIPKTITIKQQQPQQHEQH